MVYKTLNIKKPIMFVSRFFNFPSDFSFDPLVVREYIVLLPHTYEFASFLYVIDGFMSTYICQTYKTVPLNVCSIPQ